MISLAAWVVLAFGTRASQFTIPNGPHAILVLVIGLVALCVTYLPLRIALVILGVGGAWFIVVWVPGISFVPAVGISPGPIIVQNSVVLVCRLGCAGVAVILTQFFLPATYRGMWSFVAPAPRDPTPSP